MKVVVSAKGMDPDSEMDTHFGRAACFLLFDTDDGSWHAFENVQAQSAAHGAGIQAAESVCRMGAGVVISGQVGPKASSVLAAGGVRIYRGSPGTAREAVAEFRRGVWPEFGPASGQ